MKAKILVAVALLVALSVAPAASAKLRMWLTVGDGKPRVGQPVTVTLRAERELAYDLKLIAVAPGKSWYDVVGVVTGDSSRAKARIPRDGFGVPVARVAPDSWRAVVTFPRAGKWRLIIPNGAPQGFMIPPPVVRTIVVR
ncbi:hypothetical protein Gocc_2479 [Gaiella occulta]|uniref:DUF4198 domain-containing protein n=1 Tax=Gaiella occulta TaxID=1002870 RepID=A0A7M2YV73_9ACTN|nr:hypothetical protein [Gaiella occulta]RDI73915.1 hypothetical protein Gocc_2479 [Gaiella occulta]